jgi:hypothetical protein
MKTIEPVSIWDNGLIKQAKIINTFASNVILGEYANFWFGIYEETIDGFIGSNLAQGNLTMRGDDYKKWQADAYAWDWVAQQLNLTITGEYVPPVPPELTPTPEAPIEPSIESPAV